MKTYNIIKGIASLALSFFLAGTADAADWKLDKLQLAKPGEQDTLRVVLENNTFNFSSFQVDIQLPTGIQPIGNPILSPEMANGQKVSWEAQEGTNTYRCVAYSLSNNEMLAPQGTLFSIPVQLTSSFTSGTVSITEGLLANKKSETMEVTDYNKTVKATIEKKDIVVNVSGLEQMVKEGVEASLTVETIPADLPLTVEYFKDDSCTVAATSEDRKKEGTLFVKLSFPGNKDYNSFEEIYALVLTTKKDIGEENITGLKAADLVEGQLLSTSLLTGGSAIDTDGNVPIPGEFIWTNGNMVVTETGKYSVTFIPQNQTYYNTQEILVEVKVIQTYLITALSSAGGTIKITGQTEDNLYVDGQSLTLEAVPDANYRLAEWSVDGVAAGNKLTQNVTATKDMSYFATFEPIKHAVSWTSNSGGYLDVINNGTSISNGASIQQGTTLQVVVYPNAGWQLSELTLNGDSLKGNQVLVEEASTINAVFTQKPVDMYTVSAGTSLNGRLLIYKADGSLIPSGSSVPVNTQIRAVALPNAGYQTDYISYEGTEPLDQNDLHVVKGNVTITAEFGRRMFQLDAVAMNTDNSPASGTITLEATQAYYGDVVGVQVEETQAGANLLYVLANGKELEPPYDFVVTGDMTITAVFDHRVDIKKEYIMWPYQEYYYNGVSRNFVPFASQTYAGFSFDVMYQRTKDGNGNAVTEDPIARAIDAGEYNVILTREADGLYNAFNETYEEGLTIKKSTIAVTEAPANETVNPSTRPSEGVAFDSSKDGNAMKYVITPESETVKNNYNGTTYYYFLPDAPKATLNVGFSTLRSSDGQGYVRVTNGGLPYDGTNGAVEIAVGTPVTLEAVPADGYKFVKWSDGETENPRDYTVSAAATLTPEFASKSVISVALASNASVYNGAAQTVSLTGNGAAECQVTFFSDEACTQPAILKNAGTYYVRVYRPADAEYKEYDNSKAPFSYTITQATPEVVVPTASEVLAGDKLSSSELMGGHAGIVAGSFAWANPDEVVTASGEYEVIFTPADPNYAPATIKVEVKAQGVSGEVENPDDPKPGTDDPDTPTNIEAVEAQTILTGENQTILIRPAQPMTVSVINMTGAMLYHGDITDVTSIPVGNAGVYIVKMKAGEEESVRKLQVK